MELSRLIIEWRFYAIAMERFICTSDGITIHVSGIKKKKALSDSPSNKLLLY